MADDVEKWLIDLDCSIRDSALPVPLLLLPRINSPYDGKVSKEENDPFDSALHSVSTCDDPFERVLIKTQQYKNETLEESGMVTMEDSNNGALTSGVHETEASAITNKRRDVTELKKVVRPNETKINFRTKGVDLLRHVQSDGYDTKNSPEVTHTSEPHYRQPAINDSGVIQVVDTSTIKVTEASNFKFSPESESPKYCSTPLSSTAAPNKRKERAEVSPLVSKRKSLNFGNISPASLVKIRVEKCVEETENKFRNRSAHLKSKLAFRRSLDSQMRNYTKNRSNFQQETNYVYEENPQRSIHKIKYANNSHSSFKSLQMPTNDFITVSSPHHNNNNNNNVANSRPFIYTEAEERTKSFLLEARLMSKLLEVEAMSPSSNMFDSINLTLIEMEADESSDEDVPKEENYGNNLMPGEMKKKTKSMKEKGEDTTQGKQAHTLDNIEIKTTAADKKGFKKPTIVSNKSCKGEKSAKQSENSLSTMEKMKTDKKETSMPHKKLSKIKSDSNIGVGKKSLAKLPSSSSTSQLKTRNKLLQNAEPKAPQLKTTSTKSTGEIGKAPKVLKKMLQGTKSYLPSNKKTRKI